MFGVSGYEGFNLSLPRMEEDVASLLPLSLECQKCGHIDG